MTDILFYHLERQPLEKVLPILLEKSLERGWRALVRSGQAERIERLDESLWTYLDASFLPHAADGADDLAGQPVVLTTQDAAPNNPDILFLVDGVFPPADVTPYERVVVLFDGNDEEALGKARLIWSEIKARGLQATYWQQSETGRWEKKA